MAVTIDNLKDLLATTLPDLPKQEFEVAWDNPEYESARIYQSDRMVIDGGENIVRKIMLDNSGNAHYRSYYDTDEPKVNDQMHTITVPWCQLSTNYSWDKLEILHQKNNVKGFVKLLTERRVDGLWSLAQLIEERLWKAPTSASDDKYPYGVPYYFNVKDADGTVNTSTAGGFVGATIDYQGGTTGTECAGIDAATEAKWRNWAALYSNIDNALLKTIRLAFMQTRFKVPMIVNDPSNKRSAAKRMYTTFDNVADLMDLADQRDDNHTGKDCLGNLKVDDGGLVTINRLPVVPIMDLNDAAYSPIYCVDFAKFIPVIHDGYWMEETAPMTDKGQHTALTVFLDCCHQNLLLNRRTAGFVIHKDA